MNALNTIFILGLAFLAVFVESSFGSLRRALSVQDQLIDLALALSPSTSCAKV